MLFNSLEYLFFLIIIVILFYTLPQRFRVGFLLLASCFFYAYEIPVYLLIIAGSVVLDYFSAIIIEATFGKKRKFFLVLSIVANLFLLCVFKYYNFFISIIETSSGANLKSLYLQIILPIGLSFHTFQAISYIIDVYKEEQKAERKFLNYALFITFFPQMIAGPIEKAKQILPQFNKEILFNYINIVDGMKLLIWGVIKKAVISHRLFLFTNEVFNNYTEQNSITIFIAAVFYSFEIYCDFSGYTDMARGSAKILGFNLSINFNRPYAAHSVINHWSRWHITLSNWFKNYVYLPMGGNRTTLLKWITNIIIVFTLSGLWHGANYTFIIWGVYHAFFYIVDYYLLSRFIKLKFVSIAVTFFIITLSWLIFVSSTLQQAFYLINKIFLLPYNLIVKNDFLIKTKFKTPFYGGFVLPFLLICSLISIEYMHNKYNLNAILKKQNIVIRWIIYFSCILVILFLGDAASQKFIYYQF